MPEKKTSKNQKERDAAVQEWTGSLRGEMAQVSGEFARLCLY